MTVKTGVSVELIEQTALERQDLPCIYLAHHEPESLIVVTFMSGCGALKRY